jgi:hypothetical protein
MSEVANIDTLRTLGFAAIGGAYVAVGAASAHPIRIVCFTNNTDGDMFFSDDGVTDKLFVAHNSFKLFDISTNRDITAPFWAFRRGTQYYVKESTSPTLGDVYVELVYGDL